jgi:hypothetical protein
MVALKASRMNNMNSDEMNDKAGLRIRIRKKVQNFHVFKCWMFSFEG